MNVKAIVTTLKFLCAAPAAACALASAVCAQDPVNLARSATATGRGTHPEAAIDGIKNAGGQGEWIGGSPNKWYGWIDYPSLELTWQQPVTVNKVVIYDHPSEGEHLAGAILKFSDGSEVSVSAIPNDGSPKTVVFTPRKITSLKLSAVDGLGTNIGLSEIEVFHDPNVSPSITNRTFTDFVSYVDPTIETGRGRWFFCTPGSLPFGMVSASAYTRNKNQGGGGYNYNSTEIRGFTQQKCWIMSSVNLMPVTGDIRPNHGEAGWLSKFSHGTEIIEPGYHQVFLDRYRTKVEYTASERVAYYRLTYEEAAKAKLLLQLGGFVGSASYVDGQPWLSQYWVRRVSKQAYGGTCPNTGYGGHDEDQGQMGGVSALMKLGLFSLRGNCEREPSYEITSPEFDEITIQLDPRYYSGKQFIIRTHDHSPDHVYIQKATLNGSPLNSCSFPHADFAKGGTLELWLGPNPNKSWGLPPH